MFSGSHHLLWVRASPGFFSLLSAWVPWRVAVDKQSVTGLQVPICLLDQNSTIASSSSYITPILPHFLKMDKSGVMLSPEEVEESTNCLKMKSFHGFPLTHNSPLSSLVPRVAWQGYCQSSGQHAGCLLRGNVSLFTWGREELRKKPGTEQLGFG